MHDILLRSTESERKRAIFRVIDDEINASGERADLWRLKDRAICVRINRREPVGCNIYITRERRFALTNSATILFLPDLVMVFCLPFGNTKPRFRAARRGTSESSIELDLIDGFDRSGSSQRGRTLRRKELLLRLLNRCST